ncbi:DUF2239 family protein [Pseudooceanicola sp. LIPI14-2-Ac024]|uniref:DUF2239 family protein n=1 Tax=Pseudooceanicola sp. LIPI14-2-Ac024 TaxID=3344875 RepID=UPI0035D11544
MTQTFTAFFDRIRIAHGTQAEVAAALVAAGQAPQPQGVLIFDDATGRETDLDLSGGPDAVAARHAEPPRGRGRPKLGVTAREVTLLPRHWDWLAGQRGGASATLRRLIDAARAEDGGASERRDACYRFCSAIAGDLPGFEDAMRHLYAAPPAAFLAAIDHWPADIRGHAERLLTP